MRAQSRTVQSGSLKLMACLLTGAALTSWSAARADVVISTSKTKNMSCSGGVCAPTSAQAILNVTDLENYLASGNVEVTTTGSGIQANNIQIDGSLTWLSASALTFDAYQSILVYDPISITGAGGLSVTTNDGRSNGYFGFGASGNVTFANLSSALTINGTTYTLVGDIATLAADVAANSAGNFALANSYDASNDGTYQNSAIPTDFGGSFEGLGNTISNLSLNGTGDVNSPVGLFADVSNGKQLGGAIENIVIEKEQISGNGVEVGGLVGINGGTIAGSFVSGSLTSESHAGLYMGLLAGVSGGAVARCGAVGTISTSQQAGIGGLMNSGTSVSQSWADVTLSAGAASGVGGLLAGNEGGISDAYAVGKVSGGRSSDVGGLVGENSTGAMIAQTYSTTTVKREAGGRGSGYRGGLIGVDYSSSGSNTSDYWDTSTSKVPNRGGGAGHPRSDPGIAGLTTAQLQSGLPSGFDPTVWAEDPKINNGFPYLIANPPRQ